MPRVAGKRRPARKGGKRFGKRVAKRVPRNMPLQQQSATIIETTQFEDIRPGLAYNFQFHLNQFQRAARLAPLFKFYKAKRVEWIFEPLYNTFQDGTTGGEVSIPYKYEWMNRTGDLVGQNLADIQAMGVRPSKLMAATTKGYVPNWLLAGLSMYTIAAPGAPLQRPSAQGMKCTYDWLPCPNQNVTDAQLQIGASPDVFPVPYSVNSTIAANNVPYFGHGLLIDQAVPTGSMQAVARLTCRVHWVFKQPHSTFAEPTSPAVVQAKPLV